MSETLNPGAGPSGESGSSVPAAASGEPAAPAAASSASPPALAKDRIEARKSGAAGAVERAAARKLGTAAPANTNSSLPPSTVAAGADLPSAPAAGAVGGTDDTGKAAAGAADAPASAGSTVAAPDDWPEDYKARFAALPTDDARNMLLDTYKGMQRAFTESTAEVAQIRKDHKDLIETVEKHGVDAAEAARVLNLSATFAENPRKVLQQLAAQAGVEVFFERPLAQGEVPEFKDSAEMAEWVRQDALAQLRRESEAEKAKLAEERERENHRNALRDELAKVRETYGERFTAAQPAVMERLLKPVSIEDAFHLVNLPSLRQQAEEGARAKADLAAARAELEALRKRATVPPAGVNGQGHHKVDDSRMSTAERAVSRATARKAAAANAGA